MGKRNNAGQRKDIQICLIKKATRITEWPNIPLQVTTHSDMP